MSAGFRKFIFSPRSEMPHFWSHKKGAAKPAAAWQHVEEIPGVLLSLPAAAVPAPLVDETGKPLMMSFRDVDSNEGISGFDFFNDNSVFLWKMSMNSSIFNLNFPVEGKAIFSLTVIVPSLLPRKRWTVLMPLPKVRQCMGES